LINLLAKPLQYNQNQNTEIKLQVMKINKSLLFLAISVGLLPMFMKNAYDMVKRIRNHPSVAIYVGPNEGNLPEVIDTALKSMVFKKL
jgi:beta-galactosidase/beta-glucuronidase